MKKLSVLIIAFIFAAPSFAQQGWRSLHQAMAGTEVEGSFPLAGKVIPLPPGKFILVVGRERALAPSAQGSTLRGSIGLVEVILIQTHGSKLRQGVWARANVAVGGTFWTDEPCKRSDTLFRLDRLNTFQNRQDCVLVDHVTGLLSSQHQNWLPVAEAIKSKGIQVPVELTLSAQITRIQLAHAVFIHYWINPDAYGFPAGSGSSWATSMWNKSRIESDPQKVAFVKALSDWAVALKPAIDQGFEHEQFPLSAVTLPLFLASHSRVCHAACFS